MDYTETEGTVGKRQNQRQGKKIATSKIDPIKTPEGELRYSERVVSSCFLLVKSDKKYYWYTKHYNWLCKKINKNDQNQNANIIWFPKTYIYNKTEGGFVSFWNTSAIINKKWNISKFGVSVWSHLCIRELNLSFEMKTNHLETIYIQDKQSINQWYKIVFFEIFHIIDLLISYLVCKISCTY